MGVLYQDRWPHCFTNADSRCSESNSCTDADGYPTSEPKSDPCPVSESNSCTDADAYPTS
jgi:hypothetical protein